MSQGYRLQRSTNGRQRGSVLGAVFPILNRRLPFLILSEDPVGWSFEVVHLSGFHRPDESREEKQREQKRERKGDVNSRHGIDILRSNSEF